MQSDLLGTAAAIGHKHPGKRFQVGARAASYEKLRIINQLATSLLQLVHQRIFFIWVKSFVETTQFKQCITSSDQVAQDQLLFTGLPNLARRQVAGCARPKSQRTCQHERKHLLQTGSIFWANIWAANHLCGAVPQMANSDSKVSGL